MAENKSLVIKIDGNSQGLRDEFNRIKSETKNLESSLTSIAQKSAIAFAGLTATIVGLTKEFREDEQAALQTEAILKATGFAAGLTSQNIKDLSQSLQDQTTFSDAAVNSAANLLLTFKNLSKDIFPAATEAVLDMATVMGTDASSSAIQLGKALNDPVQGISALTRIGVQFTEAQKAQIETLVKNNDLLAAQKIILGEVQSQMGGAAKAAAEGTGIFIKLGNAFGNIFSIIGGNIFATLEPFVKKFYDFVITVRDGNPELFKLASTFIVVGTAIVGVSTLLATLGIGLLATKAAVAALGITFSATWAAATLGLTLLVPAIIYASQNLEALQGTLTGLQAVFTLATDSMQRGFNNVAIATTELLIKMKELGVATLEALPTQVFAEKVASMRAEIANLARSNELLIQDNKNVKRSFAEIYDEIDAEKMAAKVAAQEAAALEERQKGAELETQRKLAEDGLKLQAEAAQQDALLGQKIEAETAEDERQAARYEKQLEEEQLKNENALLAKAAYEATFSEIIRLENELRALEEVKFNNAQKARLQAQLDTQKAIRDKNRTIEEKAITDSQDRIREAEAKDAKERLEFEENFWKEKTDGIISSGKTIFKESTGIGKALFLVEKALAFQENIVNTQKAAAKAAAATAPFSAPFVAAEYAAGALRGAAIAATAITGLEDGGMVGNFAGAKSGDRYPAMLADGELVVPRKNFEQVVDGAARQRGFVKSGDSGIVGESGELVSRIEISLVDGAADFITAKQLENSRLGVNR